MNLLHSVVMILNVVFCECSEVFHEKSRIVLKPEQVSSQYFGYTVVLKSNELIVGAPLARAYNISSGAVYTCKLNSLNNKNVTCSFIGSDDVMRRIYQRLALDKEFIKNDMWLGATIGVLPKDRYMICAPRWTKPHKDTHLLANGACCLLSKRTSTILYPLKETNRQAFRTSGLRKEFGDYGLHLNYYAYGQAGFSIKVTNESIVLGAPGLLQWAGGIVDYSTGPNTQYVSLRQIANPYFTLDIGPDDYFGYSVESGVFVRNGDILYVAGAPRSKGGYGQVIIFRPPTTETVSLDIKAKAHGPQLGSYFGGALCCVDINGDGISDLLVGAPNFVRQDGGLHYDQGAVFVYLTVSGSYDIFTLTQVDYVTGSSSSGNRFGSVIADVGDVNGDGFNDIAIGAPWENDGKGAVYIFEGGINGLNTDYIQKIEIEESRAFGYSISTGVDVNGDDCNEISIGAINANTAYIFPCIPSLNVEVSIKVPDAMNLHQNATNFTALFCVKALKIKTWSHVKKDFKAKIIIDPKENRAKIKGDSEYKVTIAANSENCDEQIVEVKPTADLSRPITMKFNLEVDEDWHDSITVPPHAARLSDDSKLNSSLDIQLMRDCGKDLICKPLLSMSLQPLNVSYTPGTNDKLGIRVSIFNKEEPSFGAKVHLTLPYSPKRLPSECSLDNLSVTCNLPAPLRRLETVDFEIELEYVQKEVIKEEIIIIAELDDPMYNETDIEKRVQEQTIVITPKATFSVNGRTMPNATIAVARDKLSEAANLTMQHYYEVTNLGPSDWYRLRLLIVLPENVTLSSPVKGCSDNGIECDIMIPAKASQSIALPLKFDLKLHGDFFIEHLELNVTTTVILEGQNKSASVTTTLILEPASPIWPMIVGSIAGVLLLLLITLVLYKCGFFSRKRLEDFQRLQEQEMSAEANSSVELTDNECITASSSQELILDDSD